MNDYLGIIAPEGKKGLYMGYANMPPPSAGTSAP